MKFIKKIIIILFFVFQNINSYSEEVVINSSKMDVINNGNLVIANNAEIKDGDEVAFIPPVQGG